MSVCVGLYGAIIGPTTASTANTSRIPSPARTFGDRGRRNARKRGTSAVAFGDGPAARDWTLVLTASRLLPDARVEAHVDEVGEEVRRDHDQRDDQEDPLHHRVVLVGHRVEEQVADVGLAEDDFDQQLTG